MISPTLEEMKTLHNALCIWSNIVTIILKVDFSFVIVDLLAVPRIGNEDAWNDRRIKCDTDCQQVYMGLIFLAS